MTAQEALGYDEARRRVLGAVTPLPSVRLPLAALQGRPLREAIVAPHALPPFSNSAMDGYALRVADAPTASNAMPVTLPVVDVIPAGRVASRALGAGEAMRIMTGACLPKGADTIVPFEETERIDDAGSERVRILTAPGRHAHIRDAGRDIRAGEIALEAGRALSAHDIAVLAALGVAETAVGPRPRVAIISTGDELLDVDEALAPGAIRDSNLVMLRLLAEDAGCEVISARRVRDDVAQVTRAVRGALEQADVVLTIGGVSAGDFDPVKESLASIGDIALWRVAMRPGRPQAFGMPGGTLFYGLPGNPASVACVFEVLIRPALRKLQGFAALDRPRLRVRVGERIASRAGRVDFVRATLERSGSGFVASAAGEQVSGHLMPQARAHAWLVVPAEAEALEAGVVADALLLRWPEALSA